MCQLGSLETNSLSVTTRLASDLTLSVMFCEILALVSTTMGTKRRWKSNASALAPVGKARRKSRPAGLPAACGEIQNRIRRLPADHFPALQDRRDESQKGEAVNEAKPGDEIEIVLDHTPFYAESARAVGDQDNCWRRKAPRKWPTSTTLIDRSPA